MLICTPVCAGGQFPAHLSRFPCKFPPVWQLEATPRSDPTLLSGGLCPESHRMSSMCRQGCAPSWRRWAEGACIQVTQVRSMSMAAEGGGWSPGSRRCPTPRSRPASSIVRVSSPPPVFPICAPHPCPNPPSHLSSAPFLLLKGLL